MSAVSAGQKRAPDPIVDGCEPPCGGWELNSRPLEEQPVLLTAELSHSPAICELFYSHLCGRLSVHIKCVNYSVTSPRCLLLVRKRWPVRVSGGT